MKWQDIVIMLVVTVFTASLLPLLRDKVVLPLRTSIPMVLGSFVLAAVYVTLGLWLSLAVEVVQAGLWLVLLRRAVGPLDLLARFYGWSYGKLLKHHPAVAWCDISLRSERDRVELMKEQLEQAREEERIARFDENVAHNEAQEMYDWMSEVVGVFDHYHDHLMRHGGVDPIRPRKEAVVTSFMKQFKERYEK